MLKATEIERSVLPIVETCLKTMTENCHKIDAESDSLQIVASFQTGYPHPTDIAFSDLSNEGKFTCFFHMIFLALSASRQNWSISDVIN